MCDRCTKTPVFFVEFMLQWAQRIRIWRDTMSSQFAMEQIMKTGTIPAVAGEGIRLYDAQGNTYFDLSEISNVLGQKNAHFTKRMTDKLQDLVGGQNCGKSRKNEIL